MPVWSSTAVGGVKLLDLNPKLGQEDDPENWKVSTYEYIVLSTVSRV